MAVVTVLRHRYVRGWPTHAAGESVAAVDIGTALKGRYPSDAHFACYASPNERRLTHEAVNHQAGVTMTAAVFDIDCAEVHGSSQPVPVAWRVDLRDRVHTLWNRHPEPYFYETRGGARLVYALAEPTILRSLGDAQRWSQQYSVRLAYLANRFGIVADRACHDWQRLFRLPFVARTPGAGVEAWPAWGDPDRIAPFVFEPSYDDLVAANSTNRATQPQRRTSFEQVNHRGRGLLFHLARARGYVVREHSRDGAVVIRCPREEQHTTGRTGDTSTLLFPPASKGAVGAISCFHDACADMRVSDWVACFTSYERTVAQRAAEIA